MTGFAREAGSCGAALWAWELKSVNGRGLDIRVRVPPGLDAAGEEARRRIAAAIARGQCQLTLTIARAATAPRVRVDREVLQALLDSIADLRLPAGVGPATLDGLLAIPGVVEIDEEGGPADEAALGAALAAGASRLVAALTVSRDAEGRALDAVIRDQLAGMERLVAEAEACPGRQPEAIRARLAGQVAALAGASGLLDPARLHAEAALLATRADVREELDRLRAHLDAARALLDAAGPVGRKLDFLAQEFGREANTLCSKANDVALSRIGLDLKAAVEQFREQVQNVE